MSGAMKSKNNTASGERAANRFGIRNVAIIGAGTMGAGIAAYIAGAGMRVWLLDSVPQTLTEAETAKGLTLASPEVRNRNALFGKVRVCDPKTGVLFAPEQAELITVGNTEDDLECLSRCDWIIEAIFENLEAKKKLLKQIAPYCKPEAFITSNTSGISITKIVEDMPLEFRKRFMGTHFFNPPRYMSLFELIPGTDTCPKRLEWMRDFAVHRLGKGVVMAKDTPNFIANRIGVYNSVSVVKNMLKYGLSFEEVDQLTGPVIGKPRSASFKTSDMVGMDISKAVMETLNQNLTDPEERDYFQLAEFQKEMIANGQLGNKTGGGYYKKIKTPEGKWETQVWNMETKTYEPLTNKKIEIVQKAMQEKTLKGKLCKLLYDDSPGGKFAWDLLKGVMLYSAEKIPEIADDYRDIDNAMKWGYNWECGPFEIWDLIGVEKAAAKMQAEGETIPAWVQKKLDAGNPKFYEVDPTVKTFDTIYPVVRDHGTTALLDMGDGVLLFEAKTRGNAISSELKLQMLDAIDFLETSPQYKGMVVANSTKNFLNGADLVEFLGKLERQDYGIIAEGIDEFHAVSMRIKYANKPIVAAVRGNALGGGLEFAMHCHRVVAATESTVGLVEVGVGIVPGGGGIKEFLVRNMQKLEGLTFPDMTPVITRVFGNISGAMVSKNAFHARALGYLRETDRIVMNPRLVAEEAKKEVLRMYDDGFRCAIEKPVMVTGTSGLAVLASNIKTMREGGFISDYDAVVFGELAKVVTGGDVPKGTLLSENDLNELEKQAVLTLVKNQETVDRVRHMVTKGKPLRN